MKIRTKSSNRMKFNPMIITLIYNGISSKIKRYTWFPMQTSLDKDRWQCKQGVNGGIVREGYIR